MRSRLDPATLFALVATAALLSCGACGAAGTEAASPSDRHGRDGRDGHDRGASSGREVPLVTRKSPRLHVSIALPDGAAWKLDDRQPTDFVAEHDATRSKIVVRVASGRDLVNHERCEERARAAGFVPDGPLRTVESATMEGPDALDTRVWVAVEEPREARVVAGAAPPRAPLAKAASRGATGYVFAFGANARKCVLLRYETRVASEEDGEELSARLAVARARVVPSLRLDPVIDVVPRAPHDVRPRR